MTGFKMISLFTGAGGLDYGFEAAGFQTKIAVEMDEDCCKTLKQNRDWTVLNENIHEVESEEMLEAAGLKVKEANLLIGGPPCQPFSKSAYWASGDTKRLDDPRAMTLDAYMRVVSDTLPEVFVLENVHGISYSGKEEGFNLLEQLTEKINSEKGTNYQLSWQIVNSADYGIPQARKRFFLVAHREGEKFKFPKPTHLPPEELDEEDGQLLLIEKQRPPYTTAWDAIGDLEDKTDGEDLHVRGKWADLLPSIPEGENYLWHTERKDGLPLFKWRSRYWSFLLKLAKNRHSWTIQAQPGPAIGPFHWKSRLLSVRELARIQTFPDEIEFVGSRNSIQKQIGNAVPSLVGEVLGRAILEQFFGVVVEEDLKCGVEKREPVPEPEPVETVPEKYLELIEQGS